MRRKLLRISLLVSVAIGVLSVFSFNENKAITYFNNDGLELFFTVPTEAEANFDNKELELNHNLFLGKTYVGFKEALGFKESRNNYKTINEYGYMGKYQFGRGTLNMIGIYNSKRFLNDAKLQEQAFTAYTSRNKWILRRDIDRYVGRYIDGVKVTESGILAAAHLAGAGNVKKYLRSGGEIGFSDAFGTSIRYYLKKFSGYDTSWVEADKRAKVL
ncbi:MAG: peptidoglycan-binding protein LysM [Bacteroidia bacterium]|nr:peptidoglycan-binding protein LysM [Bacteroidia bacterium]NNF30257.1 peptidoglycan-binding protein LysM [Flavobacteriaceae bacterium]MBT8277328.1 peptidoglycan-binding protein LysM [Bacteroidia bacterium]NNJ82813.1 peptidoglycan-binding protein LysM [Flavobacteriaceae bacterium]NNK54264.1 peptidoglycan-binding protein LysM [Flavobacteriaceae bacterium]